MEEEARKLLEEGIIKKLISPGKGELSTFPNGTKVTNYGESEADGPLSPVRGVSLGHAMEHLSSC